MTYKRIWLWLLLILLGIPGCHRSETTNSQATEEKQADTVRSTGDVAYHWPPDFKLPLTINIETEEVPKEIQNPSPPIKEEVKKEIGFWEKIWEKAQPNPNGNK
jgi:hypothetical protein